MKNDLTYNAAFSKLEALVEQLEYGNIQLDKLSANVKQANELIEICENKLRNIDTEIKEITKVNTKRISRKK